MHVLCRTHILCERCRADNDDGQNVRNRLLKNDRVGVGLGPRFTCPHGRGDIGSFVPWPESKGLGDTVKRVTDFLGIEQCPPCKQRQDALNKAVPYESGNLPAQGK